MQISPWFWWEILNKKAFNVWSVPERTQFGAASKSERLCISHQQQLRSGTNIEHLNFVCASYIINHVSPEKFGPTGSHASAWADRLGQGIAHRCAPDAQLPNSWSSKGRANRQGSPFLWHGWVLLPSRLPNIGGSPDWWHEGQAIAGWKKAESKGYIDAYATLRSHHRDCIPTAPWCGQLRDDYRLSCTAQHTQDSNKRR